MVIQLSPVTSSKVSEAKAVLTTTVGWLAMSSLYPANNDLNEVPDYQSFNLYKLHQ